MMQSRWATFLAVLTVAGLLWPVGALAQDMQFTIEETGEAPAPPAEGQCA